jgi:hypothetical protein
VHAEVARSSEAVEDMFSNKLRMSITLNRKKLAKLKYTQALNTYLIQRILDFQVDEIFGYDTRVAEASGERRAEEV